MRQKIDLLNGPVFPSLAKLAVPIMATSLVQMAYNLTDMIWIGRIGSNAVASVGAAGMYMWFANGIAVLAKMGGQVKVGHALGAGTGTWLCQKRNSAFAVFRPFLWNYLPAVSRSVDRILPSEFQNRNPGCRSISRHHLRTGHIFLFEPGIYRNSDCHGQQPDLVSRDSNRTCHQYHP